MSFPPICLTLIVKNEAKVIERCLKTTLNLISTYCICDTGSTDNTKEVITNFFKKHKISGVIHDTPWVNFGVNRSILLEKSREHCPDGYSWMIDADDIVNGEIPDKSCFRAINPDGSRKYNGMFVTVKRGNVEYRRVHFFSNKSKWSYKGALHEQRFLADEVENNFVIPECFWINSTTDGSRSYDPKKYENDAKILQAEYDAGESENAHTVYYLAQSYKDAGDKINAIKYYKERILLDDRKIGVNNQEAYVSCYELVQFLENLEDKIYYAWKGIEITPKRLESSYYLLKYARENNIWKQQIYSMAISIINRTIEPYFMFAAPDIYNFCFDDELLTYAYYTNHRDDERLIPVIQRLRKYVNNNSVSDIFKQRILKNIEFFPLLNKEETKVANIKKK